MKSERPAASVRGEPLEVWEFEPVDFNLEPVDFNLELVEWSFEPVDWNFEPVDFNLELVDWSFEKPGQSNQTKTQVKKA